MLEDAAYQQIVKSRSALASRMRSINKDIASLGAHVVRLTKQRNGCVEEMKLYSEVLKPQIDEYEAVKVVKEPKE